MTKFSFLGEQSLQGFKTNCKCTNVLKYAVIISNEGSYKVFYNIMNHEINANENNGK